MPKERGAIPASLIRRGPVSSRFAAVVGSGCAARTLLDDLHDLRRIAYPSQRTTHPSSPTGSRTHFHPRCRNR